MYKEMIESYKPINEQETVDKQLMLDFINKNSDALSRHNLAAHFTVSAIVVNKEFTKVVLAYHLIYQSWAWLGGHNDDDPDFLRVAVKETTEETGLKKLTAYQKEPIMLDVIRVTNHIKNNKYIPDHLHLNMTYLLIANEK